jgi:hypothetical protein
MNTFNFPRETPRRAMKTRNFGQLLYQLEAAIDLVNRVDELPFQEWERAGSLLLGLDALLSKVVDEIKAEMTTRRIDEAVSLFEAGGKVDV